MSSQLVHGREAMSTIKSDAAAAKAAWYADLAEHRRKIWVFSRWCFRREAFTLWTYVMLLAPVLLAGFSAAFTLRYPWYTRQGLSLFRTFLWLASLAVFAGGVRHASRAVCWEVSRELRDLVRMTGLAPATLLWCRMASRWWTIGLSVLLIYPLALFARTIGTISDDQWIAGAQWLILIAVLTAGFAALSSISSSRANNAETTAALATLALMFMYHMLYWGTCILIGFVSFGIYRSFAPPPGTLLSDLFWYAIGLAPITGLYRAINAPGSHSALEPTYWVHLVTGIGCLVLSTIYMRIRLAVTTEGDADIVETKRDEESFHPIEETRPRCSNRPFFWKDTYILGGGSLARITWTVVSVIAFVSLFGSLAFGMPLVVGMIAICIVPCMVAVRFDSLMAVEFREKMWNSLMLLPVDPRWMLLEKLLAAIWERMALVLPMVVGAIMAAGQNASMVGMALVVSTLASLLMVEISILTHFYSKSWVVGPIVGSLAILLIATVMVVWIASGQNIGFFVTVTLLTGVAIGTYSHINWRLQNWVDV